MFSFSACVGVSFEQQSGACERKYESESYEHPDSGRDQIDAVPPCTCTTTGACPEARTAIGVIECIVGTQARLLWPGKRKLTAGKRRLAPLLRVPAKSRTRG